MKTIKTITKVYSKDTYEMEICEGSFGSKSYYISINGVFNKSYKRIPKDLREFFNI